MNVKLYGVLVERARNRGHVFYSKTGPGVRGAPGTELEAISRHENAAGRPLLSVLVVDKGTGKPNSGFVQLGRELGLLQAGETEQQFVERQTKAVHDTWEA